MFQGLNLHKAVVKRLEIVRDRTFKHIEENIGKITEHDIQQFILAEFKIEGLILMGDKDKPIVAVNKNTSFVHYFPEKNSETITKDSLILIDIWARLKDEDSYFGDLTWMAYSGKEVPIEIQRTFDKVINARDKGIRFIRESLTNGILPKCSEVDKIVRESFGDLKERFLHNTGHSIGFNDCHGEHFILGKSCDKEIAINIPFTMEPGLYFEDRFGIRSEIDCYINENYELIITSEVQDKIIFL